MFSASKPHKFNRSGCVIEGWYWALPSAKLKRGRVRAITLMGRDLAIFRGRDGNVVALDAYCPHMGAHLAEGHVEGNALRCFFHNWRFDRTGRCTDIPCLDNRPSEAIRVRSWPVREKYGLIWVWTGSQARHDVPEVPELAGTAYESALGNCFVKKCHPNVVMINAIDEQHFHTVHHLPGSILRMASEVVNDENIRFRNTGNVPSHTLLGRFVGRFYRTVLTYSLSYWYGSLGTVTFGPDFLNLHLMFALRQGSNGETEGQTILFTRRRRGPFGWLANRVLLALTSLGGRYFAGGDTRVFETIRFHIKTPIAADRSVIAFIKHLEGQPVADWNDHDSPPDQPPLAPYARMN